MIEEAAAPKTRPDFSWDALKDHAIHGHPSGAKTLQEYWRLNPGGGPALDDDALKNCGLIRKVGGVQWHIVHLPAADRWKTKPGGATQDIVAQELGSRLAAAENGTIVGSVMLDGAVLQSVPLQPASAATDVVRCVSWQDALFLGKADFAGWHFGQGTSFARAEFLGDVSFAGAEFHGEVDIANARFAGNANFGNTRFHQGARFDSAQFEAWNFFEDAQFSQGVSFEGALFHEYALFKKAIFHRHANFRYATFFKKADFHLAEFMGPASFERAEFLGVAAFLEAKFSDQFSYQRAIFKHLCEFYAVRVTGRREKCWRSAFDGAEIRALFNLADGPHHIISAFNGAILSGNIRYPIQGEQADAKSFKANALNFALRAGGSKQQALSALEGGARVLKHAMAGRSDSLREQQFYRYEIEARRRNATTPNGEKFVSWLYGWVSQYSLSITRPLVFLLVSIAVFGVFYATFIGHYEPAPDDQTPWRVALQSSVAPFSVWDPRWINASPWLSSFQLPWTLLALQIASTIQSLISIGLIFLSALAVRRRFQIS